MISYGILRSRQGIVMYGNHKKLVLFAIYLD